MANDTRRFLFLAMPIVDLTEAGVQHYLYDTRSIVNLPYGLLCIDAYLHRYAARPVETRIANINDELVTAYREGRHFDDALRYFEEYVEKELREFAPDVVGLSVMFSISYRFLDAVAALVKKVRPEAVVVVGGNLATAIPDEMALRANVDAVVFGEGEIPMLQLADSDDPRAHLRGDPAFVTRASVSAGVRPVNRVVEDLDSIPPIDFRSVNLENFNLPRIRRAVYKKDFSQGMVSRIIYVTRGCPYNCNFCAGFNVHGKKVRFMSIERVIADVQAMVDNDGLTELFIGDDAFLIHKRRAKEILRALAKMKIHVNLPSILMRNIDDEIAELLAELGNTFQFTSMESGSDFVLKQIIDKPISKTTAAQAVASLRKHGIEVLTNIVIGSPGETDEHRRETLQTLDDIGFGWVYFIIAVPLPGSRLYKQCKESGYLVSETFCSPSLTECNIRTPEYPPEHIERQAYMMNLHTNFVHNYNMRVGNLAECIHSFQNVAQAHPDHAFAHYFLARAYERQGAAEAARENQRKFEEILARSPYWKQWAEEFALA